MAETLRTFRQWLKRDDAVAAIEAGLLFPVMLSFLVGMVDLGTGLNLNQKVTNASAMMADLLTRDESVSDLDIEDAGAAALLAIEPYNTAPMGYDVAGVQFIGVSETPTVQWRETFNMDPNGDVTTDSAGLGAENEGVIAVTVKYDYEPLFSSFMTGIIELQEVFYARGRKSSFVTRI